VRPGIVASCRALSSEIGHLGQDLQETRLLLIAPRTLLATR
jgi:hypothetical protein